MVWNFARAPHTHKVISFIKMYKARVHRRGIIHHLSPHIMKIFKIQNLCGVAHFSFVYLFFSLFCFACRILWKFIYIGPIAKGNFVIAVCKRVTCNRPHIPDYTHGRWIVDTGCTHDNRLSNFICRMNISPSTVNGKCFDGFNIFVGDSISEIHTHT